MRIRELLTEKENTSQHQPHLYLDMDGVQADFFEAWQDLEGVDDYKDIENPEESIKKSMILMLNG